MNQSGMWNTIKGGIQGGANTASFMTPCSAALTTGGGKRGSIPWARGRNVQ